MKAFQSISILLLLLTTGINFSCKDSKNIDPIPNISLANISALNVKEFVDSITIIIQYQDEDGDLGFADPDSNALYVKDARLSNPDFYYIPLLAPENSGVSIKGNINIRLRNTFLIGSGDEEFTRYTIKLKDRSGNWSNEVVTPIFTITK